jgi:hypothetical protein
MAKGLFGDLLEMLQFAPQNHQTQVQIGQTKEQLFFEKNMAGEVSIVLICK